MFVRGALMPAGFSAAGRSSTDPATARKVEAKKRGKRKEPCPGRGAAGERAVGHDCACHGHGRMYSCADKSRQVYFFSVCIKRVSPIITPPATSPQNAPEMPAKEVPEAVTRKVIAAASRVAGSR